MAGASLIKTIMINQMMDHLRSNPTEIEFGALLTRNHIIQGKTVSNFMVRLMSSIVLVPLMNNKGVKLIFQTKRSQSLKIQPLIKKEIRDLNKEEIEKFRALLNSLSNSSGSYIYIYIYFAKYGHCQISESLNACLVNHLESWVINSGSTDHMTNFLKILDTCKPS